jgi:hypothetical protein
LRSILGQQIHGPPRALVEQQGPCPRAREALQHFIHVSGLHRPVRQRLHVILKAPLSLRVLKALTDGDLYYRMHYPEERIQIEDAGKQEA